MKKNKNNLDLNRETIKDLTQIPIPVFGAAGASACVTYVCTKSCVN